MAIGFIVRHHISVAVLCVAAQLTHCSVRSGAALRVGSAAQPILRHLSLQSSHTDAMLGPSLGAAASDAASDDRSDDASDQDEPQEASGGARRPAVNAIGQTHKSPTLDIRPGDVTESV